MSDDYSIWLQPDPDSSEYHHLKELIGEYSQKYDDAPIFEPHITLVGGLSDDQDRVSEITQHLAQEHQPFEISFARVHCSTTRFQCVFLLVEPILEILSLHKDAVELCGANGGMYVPHLSLIYSDMRLEERLELVDEIESEPVPDTALLNSITVVETTGNPSEWKTIGEYEL